MYAQERMRQSRIPFSQRLFWSVFFIFLGFTACVFVFQYQREVEFTREKLNSVLSSYNYQLHYRVQKDPNLNAVVEEFVREIPEHGLRVTIIDPSGKVLFDNTKSDIRDNHNNRSEVLKARQKMNAYAIRSSGTDGQEYF